MRYIPKHGAFLVHCRPDDGRLTTETCCLNEYNIRLPVTRILTKQLCLTVLSGYILFTSNEGRKMLLNLKMVLLLCCNVDNWITFINTVDWMCLLKIGNVWKHRFLLNIVFWRSTERVKIKCYTLWSPSLDEREQNRAMVMNIMCSGMWRRIVWCTGVVISP